MLLSQSDHCQKVAMFIILILVFSLLALRRWKMYRLIQFSKRIKCGFKSLPFIGHGYIFMGDGARRMEGFQKIGRDAIKNGGRTGLWLGDNFYLVDVDAKDLTVIMKTSLEKDTIVQFAQTLIGNGIIFAPVPIWHKRRKIMAPTFSPMNLKKFLNLFAQKSEILVQSMEAEAGKGVFSLWKYMNNFFLDSVCATTLDVKLDAQKNSKAPFLESIEVCCRLIASRMVQPWLYPNAVYKLLPCYTEYMKHKNVVHDFINEAILAKRQQMKVKRKELENDTTTKSFLELLIESSGGKNGYSDQELHEETLVIVVAGTDTSTTGAGFAAMMLANHPDVQEKVYQELQEVFGDSDRPITSEDVLRLKYMDVVIKETFRLYPPVPIVVRRVEKDVPLPSGITLVDGCKVLINIWAVHRNPLYWGDDAELFRPERFNGTPYTHPAAYIPFSHGPRTCLGYQYAMISLKTVMATLLRKYKILRADDVTTKVDEPLKLAFDVMLRDADGFKVKIEKRK